MTGALLAIISALTFGLNSAALRRGVMTGGLLQAMAITVPIGVPLFAVACLFGHGIGAFSDLRLAGWLWMALAGVVHFVAGRYGNYRATRALGATLSGPVQQLSVPIALILAVIFLGESLTPIKTFGFLLVMGGPLVMSRRNKVQSSKQNNRFKPRYLEGFAWGGLCALAYGISPVLITLGLADSAGGIGASLAGGLISYSAAAVVVAILVLFAGGVSFMDTLDHKARRWFIFTGVAVFASQMFRYMALAIAPVSVVVPIQRLSVIFRAIFGWLLNREHEVLNGWVVAGISISFVGAVALSVKTAVFLSLLPVSWDAFLTLRWP